MVTDPLVGVVMPVFNGEKYLAPTIEAILGQTFTAFEFIIVNDGSTDSSREIIEKYSKKDSRISIIDQQNGGISRALNAGIQRLSTPYIAPIDQDDISLPHRLEVEVAALEVNPDVVCVGGWYEIIDAQGRYLTTLQTPRDDSDIQRIALTGASPICHSGCMLRREAVVKVGGYDPTFDLAQDLDLYLRLGEVGRLQNLEIPVLRYRLHAGASSERRGEEQRECARAACELAWQRRGIEGTFEAADAWRPGPNPDSQLKFMLTYGWWAFNSKQRQTAIIYGWRAIRARPFRSDGWRLLAIALLKPLGSQR